VRIDELTDQVDGTAWPRLGASGLVIAIRPSPRRRAKARATRFWEHRSARHLLTGLVHCGSCGSRMASVGRDYLACSAARGRGTCTNRTSIRRGPLEELILEGLRHNLMTGKEVEEEFVAAFHAQLNAHRHSAFQCSIPVLRLSLIS
jgi:hypothetical protein